jgi:hypothetical protein
MGRWTATVEAEPGEREEIDVTASNKREARSLAEGVLRDDYDDGWRVVDVEPFTVDALQWSSASAAAKGTRDGESTRSGRVES